MLYRVIKHLIEIGATNGLADKIDVFYATNKLTEAEYTELMELLS